MAGGGLSAGIVYAAMKAAGDRFTREPIWGRTAIALSS